MNYTITLNRAVDFAPKTEVEEILQNVRTILATLRGSVPLDRDLGVSWEHVDKPRSLARSLIKQDIIEAIEEYEPRVRVRSVEFNESAIDAVDGLLGCRVVVSIGDDDTEEDW